MKTTIYNSELNDFSRKFLVKNPGVPDPSPYEFIAQKNSIDASLFENSCSLTLYPLKFMEKIVH